MRGGKVQIRRFCIFAFCMPVLLCIGCAHQSFPDYPARDTGSYSLKSQADGVIAAVEPMTSVHEQKRYFGTDLRGRDILPVFVSVKNIGAGNILVSKECFSLMDRAKLADKSGLASGEDLGAAEVVAVGLLSLPAALVASSFAVDAENIKHNFESKQLRRQTVSAGQSAEGFVYFPVTSDLKNRSEAAIAARVKDLVSGRENILTFNVQME